MSKGYLPFSSAREGMVAQAVARKLADKKQEPTCREWLLRWKLDRYLGFNDLWTGLGYHKFHTIWSPLIPGAAFRARRGIPDSEPDGSKCRYDPHYDELNRKVVRGGCEAVGKVPTFAGYLANNFAPQARRRTLLLVTRESPYFVDELSSAELVL